MSTKLEIEGFEVLREGGDFIFKSEIEGEFERGHQQMERLKKYQSKL